ncbi:GMC oxidoreductase [Phlyctema vagabunda]|uniref:GMC oxidoreductase n=1 Tax=Phlyctema vagabunda TaxID=108571 RepID=A0ABR4P8E3_9HELO
MCNYIYLVTAQILLALASQGAAFPNHGLLPVRGDCDSMLDNISASSRTYDYLIVGGGLTGLVVANRLTEDNNKSVLVIEAGNYIDTPNTKIPYAANSALDPALLWPDYLSKAEPQLNNTRFPVPVAKVLGGGSVINGMVYDRGSAADYDAWEALGNQGWGWAGLKPYFIKGTTLVPPMQKTIKDFNITYDPSVYGSGPLHLGIADFQYPDLKSYFAAWRGAGVHMPEDGNNGEAYGASWFPNTMNPLTGERAHARVSYYDPISNRTNINVLLNTLAEEIIFNNDPIPVARGIRLLNKETNETLCVYARKEVVLAAGAIQTPKLLQLSGIGSKTVLEAAGIQVKVALDAVGANFQDHAYTSMIYNVSNLSYPNPTSLTTDPAFNISAWQQYTSNKTGPYTQARGNSLAFISLPEVTSTTYEAIVQKVKSLETDSYLPNHYKDNQKLLNGVQAQRNILANLFSREDAAVVEYTVPAIGSYALVGLEKPLSRGLVMLNASDPQGPPVIDFNTFMNPIDKSVFAASVRYQRSIWNRPELAKFSLTELSPGAQYRTDDEIINRLVSLASISPTLAHPSGTCAMMPEDLGGCVSDKLLVYGTSHLSIIDASILPIIPSCHLQATMYGVAEKAADIIKARA